jgi:hypothetical protein
VGGYHALIVEETNVDMDKRILCKHCAGVLYEPRETGIFVEQKLYSNEIEIYKRAMREMAITILMGLERLERSYISQESIERLSKGYLAQAQED